MSLFLDILKNTYVQAISELRRIMLCFDEALAAFIWRAIALLKNVNKIQLNLCQRNM